MNTKLISIIIGAILVVGTGSLVYVTKKPVILPSENSVTQESNVNGNTKSIDQTTVKTNTQNIPVKNFFSDDDNSDDNEENEDGSSGVVNNPVTPTPTPKTTTTSPATPSGITLTQIAKHDSSTSCWSAINGSVYDLTSWIPNHPGGSRTILSICGIDGSNGYNGQHGGRSGPARILGGFKIGTFSQ